MGKVVQMQNITKIFPGIVANDKVNFDLEQGEVHSIAGENGAGKTTLMNILYGLYQPEEGEIYINEKKVNIKDPNVAISLGIGMVHQHFMLVPPLTIAENIVLGSEITKGLFLDMAEAERQIKAVSEEFGLMVDPKAKVENITVGMQQRVEILKMLFRRANILILDEPTAVLTPQEIEELFQILKKLVKQGKSIIIITHKLNEVMALSDRVTVMRLGKCIGTVKTKETTQTEIARMMVGRDVILRMEKGPSTPKDVIMEVKDLHGLNDRGLPSLRGLSFSVRAGEVLGIAGVEGNGQTELIEAITGLRKINSGDIFLNGKNVNHLTTRQRIEAGIAHIPEDRHKRGLVLDFSIEENSILESYYKPPFAKWITLDFKKVGSFADNLIKEYDVRTPSKETLARSLSGGNQQKVIIGREVSLNPDLLIAAQPTRGLDVGAIEFVHKRIIEQRDSGKAVLLVSLELEEVLSLSDRIAVIYEGKIVHEIDGSKATPEELGYWMTGGSKREEKDKEKEAAL